MSKSSKAKDSVKLAKKYAKAYTALVELTSLLGELDEDGEFDGVLKVQVEEDGLVIVSGKRRFTVKTTGG